MYLRLHYPSCGIIARWDTVVDVVISPKKDSLPRLLRIAVVACLKEVPGILEDDEPFLNGLRPTMFTIVHRQADTITIAEDGDILL